MLAVALIWGYIFFLTVNFGQLFYKSTKRFLITEQAEPPGMIILSLTGLCLLTSFLGIFSLFYKIGLFANLIFFSIAILCFLFNFKSYRDDICYYIETIRKSYPIVVPLSFILIGAVLLASCPSPSVDDTNLYHAQAIQWLNKYPAIFGLGNLHGRLAFNSSFFLPSALFSFSFLKVQTFYVLNGYLCLLFVMTIVDYIRGRKTYALFFAALLWVCLHLFRGWISSPTPDLAMALFIWFVFILLLKIIERKETHQFSFDYLVIVGLVLTAVTIKISAGPGLLFLFYVSYFCRRAMALRHYVFLSVAFLFVMAPWLIRNIILSGYLIYPLPSVDLFGFDWKIPIEGAISEVDWIRSWAIMPGRMPQAVLTLPFATWFATWFRVTAKFEKLIFVLSVISPIALLANAFFNFKRLRGDLPIYTIWGISFTGFLFWFWSAPNFRLGYGFITVCALVTLLLFIGTTLLRSKILYYFIIALVFMFGTKAFLRGIRYYHVKGGNSALSHHFLVLPERIKEGPTELKTIKGLEVRVGLCYDAPVPCTPRLSNGLELRGETIEKGFRIRKAQGPGPPS